MERHQKNIDNLFKEELGGYTETPPPAVWDALEKRLDGSPDKRKFYFRWYWFALILIGISLGAAVITKTPLGLFTASVKEKQQVVFAPKTSTAQVNSSTHTQPLSATTLANTNTINEPIKKHSKKTVTPNKTSADKQEALVEDPDSYREKNKQPVNDNNNASANNKTIAYNTSLEDNNPTLASPPTENHIAFKKYEHEENKIVKTKQHNIHVTQAEPLEPIIGNNNSHALKQTPQQNIAVENKPTPIPEQKKKADVNKYASPTQKTAVRPAISVPKPSKSTHANAARKNNETSKGNKPIVKATISKTEHKEKQALRKNTISIAPIAKKAGVTAITKNIATTQTNHKKHITGQSKPNTYAAKKAMKTQGKQAMILKASGNALTQKSAIKHHNNKHSKQAIAVNKTIAHKTVSKQHKKSVPAPALNIYGNSNTLTVPNKQQPVVSAPKNVAYNKQEPKVMTTFKPDTSNAKKTPSNANSIVNNNTNSADSNAQGKLRFGKFEAGIKAGYEGGFNNNAAHKFVVSPYLQYNISPKLSIMTQPSINTSHVSVKLLSGTQSFYQVNNDGKYTMDSVLVVVAPSGDTIWRRNYNYTQSHDSIIKSYTSGGIFVQIELPILAKYNITKKLSVYGGPVLDYSRLVGVKEKTYNSGPIVKSGSSFTVGSQAPAVPPIDSVITYSGTPISNYNGSLYPSEQNSLFSFGYMFGISYEFRKRWLIDGLIHQSFVKPDVQGGYDINKPYSAPYFRITLGYKLIK